MQLIIDTAQTSLGAKNKSFFIENHYMSKLISPKRISSIAITVNCNISSTAIKLAAINQIPIYFFNRFGSIQARLHSPYFTNLALIRKKQLLFYNSPLATEWIIYILKQKTDEQIVNLRRLMARKKRSCKESTKHIINKIIQHKNKFIIYKSSNIDHCRSQLLGIEGNIGKLYFRALNCFLPEEMKFSGRSRRPAKDYFNAALNYLYGMTYSVVESGIFAKGLDPFAGFLHTENYLKTSLVFDLIEPIRPLMDRMLLDMLFKNSINKTHFIKKEEKGYWLNKKGKRVLIPSFNDYMYQRIQTGNHRRRLKDIIYAYSNELGNIIMNYEI